MDTIHEIDSEVAGGHLYCGRLRLGSACRSIVDHNVPINYMQNISRSNPALNIFGSETSAILPRNLRPQTSNHL